MYLTPEQKVIGRRNFWRTAGRGVDLNLLNLETSVPHNMAGDPVKAGIVGLGAEGGILLRQCLKEIINIQAICDRQASGW
jgi:hypothetical protein